MDKLTPAKRSWNMSRVPAKDTGPEMRVRRLIHSMGMRFRLHYGNLPGKPDLVLPKHRLVIFVHGCFWHRHVGCHRSTTPAARAEFWKAKFEATVARDARQQTELESNGWRVLIIWECETKDSLRLRDKIAATVFPSRA